MTLHNSASPPAQLLKTKEHFLVLDGLRGVAALAVVVFHFMEMAIWNYSKLFIGHGFLAVDFFFCLSGFVLGYAYDNRVRVMGLKAFFESRLIRLHPLVISGSILGLIAFYADPFTRDQFAYSPGKVALIFLASLLLVPYPVMRERGHNNFGMNAPAWSLFWEYVANIVYATVLVRLSRRRLLVLTLAAGLLLCWVGYRHGALSGGWSGKNFWDGGARVMYSFLAGLLVYRSRWMPRTCLGFTALSVLLLLGFFMPYVRHGWVREAVVILFYFPLLVGLGAGATLTPRTEKLCTFAGKMSYPLYMTHYAVIWIWGNYYATRRPDMHHLALIVTCGVLVTVGAAYLVMRFYDIPLRRYLRAQRVAHA